MQLVHLKPGPGRDRVRDPRRRGFPVIPPEGYPMPLDEWARRRLADKDLVRVRPPRPEPAPPAKAAKRKEG